MTLLKLFPRLVTLTQEPLAHRETPVTSGWLDSLLVAMAPPPGGQVELRDYPIRPLRPPQNPKNLQTLGSPLELLIREAIY